ncbi:MAG: hypothetical protein M1817_000763 [Caeruleum heppii]|nr:MAG: hypothetical protein M1817_000763 [Caeruleum heppii]
MPPLSEDVSEDGALPPTPPDDPRIATSRWVNKIPLPVRRVYTFVVTWSKGPRPPQIQKINPFFPRIQQYPLRLLDRAFPKRRYKIVLLLVFYFCWLLAFSAVLHQSAVAGDIEGYGTPAQISCGASYWQVQQLEWIVSGADAVKVLNPHAVGAQEALYQQLVVGGPKDDGFGLATNPIYRGDSFLCGAAIHAGLVSNQAGGCGVVSLVGEHDDYVSTVRNGIESIAFDSTFPMSFSFRPGTASRCHDLRWPMLGVSLTFTILLSIFTRSPSVLFASIFVGIYLHVGFASDPPSLGSYYSITSLLIGRFLPAAFVAFVLYRYVIRRTLTGLEAPVEKTILWLGGVWVGALTNYTFDFIPIQRLTPHDLDQQPGAKAALVIIVLGLLAIALGQIWYLRQEGRFPRMLALYITFGVVLSLFVAVPGLNLRIHHYILAILLLPGTSMQTRPSLLWQGILVGFFLNGIARWGFDSILQTPAALLGDGQLNTPLPVIETPQVMANNITFRWDLPSVMVAGENTTLTTNANVNASSIYDGISILVNDVERYRGYEGYDPMEYTYSRRTTDERRYYFRFGYMRGSEVGDYTKAGTWTGEGDWIPMADGPSLG